jgi:hypothetical protein
LGCAIVHQDASGCRRWIRIESELEVSAVRAHMEIANIPSYERHYLPMPQSNTPEKLHTDIG